MFYEDEKNSWINLNILDVYLMLIGCKIFVFVVVLLFIVCVLLCFVVMLDIYDLYEDVNCNVYVFNLVLDCNIVCFLLCGYGIVILEGGCQVVFNVVEYLGLLVDILNNVLQGDLCNVGNNMVCFVVNIVFGVFGIGDMVIGMGIFLCKIDFGEMLYVWGVGEGVYVELLVFGLLMLCDMVGIILDFVFDLVLIVLLQFESYVGMVVIFVD